MMNKQARSAAAHRAWDTMRRQGVNPTRTRLLSRGSSKIAAQWMLRADSVYENWRSKTALTPNGFRTIVGWMAAWYETYTGEAPNDSWFDSVIETLDLHLSADEIQEQIADRCEIPEPPSNYKPGMSLEEVEAPELVRQLIGTIRKR